MMAVIEEVEVDRVEMIEVPTVVVTMAEAPLVVLVLVGTNTEASTVVVVVVAVDTYQVMKTIIVSTRIF